MKFDIPFFKQTTSLNCGQTALKMALAFLGQNVEMEDLERLSLLNMTKGTNTIQLVIAAISLENRVEFFTKHAGFNKSNEELEFVKKYSSISEKEMNSLILIAKSRGANIIEETLSLNSIKEKLNKDCAIIVLIDWNVVLGKKENGYQGHFVPIVGYDEENIIVHNSDSEMGKDMMIKNNIFDEARKAMGTDEDVMIVYRK